MPEGGNIVKTVLKVDLSECESLDKRYIEGIRYLKSYIRDMKFITHLNTKRRLQCYIEAHFNYDEAVKKLNSEGDNLNYDCLKSCISNINSLIKKQFGDVCSIINCPDENNIELLHQAVKLNKGKVGLSSVLSKYVDDTFTRKYDLHTCKKELLFVMLLCQPSIDKMLENMDKNKLRYICTLLSYPIKNRYDANELEDFLKIEKIVARVGKCKLGDLFGLSDEESVG